MIDVQLYSGKGVITRTVLPNFSVHIGNFKWPSNYNGKLLICKMGWNILGFRDCSSHCQNMMPKTNASQGCGTAPQRCNLGQSFYPLYFPKDSMGKSQEMG